ncbi:tetratricopeptide repeat-containing diguanylate cyclase [Ideonella sp. DXS22W]|uniref:Tetratricopeptide repeat-containing diguanylate cyclase n=1 Tax=Pseudaquabacterium inlustre TaxID=2984192 RepID=A0ABU9CJ10_9BURK
MPARIPRHPHWLRAAVLPVWLAGCLGGAVAGAHAAAPTTTPTATAPATAASAPATRALRPVADDARLEALDTQARAQPLVAADAAATLAERLRDDDPVRLQALGLRAALLAGHNQLAAAERSVQAVQRLAAQPLGAAVTGWARAMLEARRGPVFRAERLLDEAIARLPDDAPATLRLRMLASLARLNEDSGRLDDALRLRQQAVTVADAQGVAWRRSEARASLAFTLLQAQQLDAARTQHRQAMALAGDDALALAHAWNIAAFLHDVGNDPVAELRAMNETIAQARRGGSRTMEVLGLANLSDHYLKRGQYAVALAQAREALPLARALGDANSESVALANIGLALVSLHRLDEGLAHLAQAMAVEERAGAEGALALLVQEQGTYLERAGYLREAFASYQRLRPLADALDRRTQQDAMVELQERFEAEHRQRELALLQREGQLRETQLNNQALQQRVWIAAAAGGALLLAVAALLLRRLRRQGLRLVAGNAALLHQSERDPLTGLANRRHLQRRMAPAAGNGHAPALDGALLLIDLDHFKQVNDRHGHAAGDAVLVAVAQRLQQALRQDDLLLRWGGEEFLVLASARDAAALDALALRLLEAIGLTPVALPDGTRLRVTASLGHAGFPLQPTGLAPGWEPALGLVDAALYLAKAHGRNRACGVRQIAAAEIDTLRRIASQLEQAQVDGLVTLTHLPGPLDPASGGASETGRTAAAGAGPDPAPRVPGATPATPAPASAAPSSAKAPA